VQAVPHFALEIDPAIDFAFFSAYKMYAPHMGFWYASRTVLDRFVRGDDAYPPGTDARNWTLECGTQSYEALAGWLGTMSYLRDLAATPRLALESIASHELELSAYACRKFAERAPNVRLLGRPPETVRLPVFAFNVEGMASDDLAQRFETAKIEARVGDYYAPRLMQRLSPETLGRAVRLSFMHYNTHEEIDRCFDVIDGALSGEAPETEHEMEPESHYESEIRSEAFGR
jgi:selenocysteine lyase/cysteine desulfurase